MTTFNMALPVLGLFVLCFVCISASPRRPSEGPLSCGRDTVPMLCGKSCEPSCTQPMINGCWMPMSCTMECRCRDELVRNTLTGQCVALDQCPNRQ